jgi:signal transduction histidine kinase
MSTEPTSRLISSLRFFSHAAAVTAIVVGALVLVGWMLDIPALKSVLPGLVTMKANTALALLLAGVSLWLLRTEQAYEWARRIAQACAFTVTMVGLLTLSEYLFGWDMGIDQLLFLEPLRAGGTSQPGRMAPATALSLALLGLAMLRLSTRRGHLLAHSLSLTVALGSLLAVIGYVHGVKSLHAIAPFWTMEVNSALALTLLCVGLLFARPDRGLMAIVTSDSAAGVMARRFLPPAILMPAVLGWLIFAGRHAGLYGAEIGLLLVVVSSIIFPAALIWWNAGSLYRMDVDRKQAERRLKENTAQIVAVNKELESFSYSVSHDLRAPLRAIDGFSRALLEEHSKHLDPEGQRLLGMIRTGTKQMGRLIDDLLVFSRISRKVLEKSNVEMTGMARSVMYELLQLEPDRFVAVTINHLAAAQGDRAMIRQAFTNLISNALKFTRHQPKPAVEIGWYRDGNEDIYYVKDNGVGFDMRYVNRLFGIFQRLHRAEEFEGTGAGLAIVQHIIHRHGGRIWAEGKVNEGATLYFALPRGRETI